MARTQNKLHSLISCYVNGGLHIRFESPTIFDTHSPGLGDRHCSNLMLDRQSGKIIHIDFGDCFEVAMLRDKFPEKIPFRLTRMLVNAMGVSGIEGNFRTTCQSVMRVLRENKESLMAVLEAFVYDPLISWRLLTPKDENISNKSKGKALLW
jgi:FKBP12-rapamycin complex-associated protein